jgi:hypothetical protein
MSELGDKVGRIALEAVALEWKKQGHELTGQSVKSMQVVELDMANGIRLDGYVPANMVYLNTGIPANRIPYSPVSGKRFSLYIEGLRQYAKKRMNASDKEALGIAFAIASKHKREGMPTRTSARYSQTGKRTGFIEAALEAKRPEMERAIIEQITNDWQLLINVYFKSVLNR